MAIFAYSDAGSPWQPQRLFQSVMPFSKFRAMIVKAIEAGKEYYIQVIPKPSPSLTENPTADLFS